MTKGIVIGAGRSFWESNVMNEIKNAVDCGKMNDVYICISDRIAKNVIEMGITPDNSNLMIATVEYMGDSQYNTNKELIEIYSSYYFNKYVVKYSDRVGVWIGRSSDPIFYNRIKDRFIHTNQFTRYGKIEMIKRENMICPNVMASNVGIASYQLLRTITGCDQIAFIGLDFKSYVKDDGSKEIRRLMELNDNWKNEGIPFLHELDKYKKEILHINLSPYGMVYDSDLTLNCTLRQFLENDFIVDLEYLGKGVNY